MALRVVDRLEVVQVEQDERQRTEHIHRDFADSFAAWLGDTTGLPVCVGEEGLELRAGHVYLAPPYVHLRLGPERTAALSAEPELPSRPSGDELLRSVATHAGPRGVAAVLTGMGDDGARGLLAVRQRGGSTYAQDADSSAVADMPRAAQQLGGAQTTLPVEALGAALSTAARRASLR